MALTYFLSAQPSLDSGLGTLDTVLRKGAHMTEFGLLWFLWWRALGYRHLGTSIAIALGYAATDEWHQTFVAGRHGSPLDVLIDAGGASAAALWALRRG
jgi:VanZ family protein